MLSREWGMDPYSSPYIIPNNSTHHPFHSPLCKKLTRETLQRGPDAGPDLQLSEPYTPEGYLPGQLGAAAAGVAGLSGTLGVSENRGYLILGSL